MGALKQVSFRLDEATWLAMRSRALRRGESAQEWLTRCIQVCLGVAETGIGRGGVTAEAVEPLKGSDVVAEKKTDGRAVLEAPHAVRTSGGLDRTPETRCVKCGEVWRLHQDGTKKNRASRTGCTTFTDPFQEQRI